MIKLFTHLTKTNYCDALLHIWPASGISQTARNHSPNNCCKNGWGYVSWLCRTELLVGGELDFSNSGHDRKLGNSPRGKSNQHHYFVSCVSGKNLHLVAKKRRKHENIGYLAVDNLYMKRNNINISNQCAYASANRCRKSEAYSACAPRCPSITNSRFKILCQHKTQLMQKPPRSRA